jgi:phage terminase small subunit
MGVLNNPKWELFAREAAKGAKGATAYKAAGYTATDKAAASNAYKLLQRADIKARVAELMNERDEQRAEASEKAMEKLAIDREWVLGKMIEQASAASAMAQHGSAIRALELIGKEFGMFVERRESVNLYANLSDDELAASLQRYIRRDDADGAARLPEASH